MKPISTDLKFNPAPPTFMHVDINSCFATIEQQANPLLRGKAVAVAASRAAYGCVLAASIEAKRLGIYTGMRVKDAVRLCSGVIVLEPDADKYRFVHQQLQRVLLRYSAEVVSKSIDEFSVDMRGYVHGDQVIVGERLRNDIFCSVGEWIHVSIGFGPNRFLAKTAASLYKPDGLAIIDATTIESSLQRMSLTDLCGISYGNAARLQREGILTPLMFYAAPFFKLKAAFASITAYYWYMAMHGYELPMAEMQRSGLSNSYVLPRPHPNPLDARPVITKLIDKLTRRLRHHGWSAHGIALFLRFADHTGFKVAQTLDVPLFTGSDMYQRLTAPLVSAPAKPVQQVVVACFHVAHEGRQLDLFGQVREKERLALATDHIAARWGDYTLFPARMLAAAADVPDRIAFGRWE